MVDLFYPFREGVVELPISFCFDYISFFFFSFVSLISSVVFLYSKFYMGRDFEDGVLSNYRFFFLLFLFVLSMMFLVFSGSWVVGMLGWDGLGLVSFLLVIYYNSPSSLDCGLVTVFTNRLGDCFFILSFMFIFYSGWVGLDFVCFLSYRFVVIFFLMLGAVTKSAQVPFSSWLPAAMAAPTPVSSLVHSSTLVTAGVYLLIRFNFLLVGSWTFLSIISLFTIVLAGVRAVCELDFKKVVAMSTLRQLGFMVFSISLGFWVLSFLHVVFHAFFKSRLFLSTGSLIHYLRGNQDSRFFGSLGSSRFSKLLFSMRVLCLCGFPFSLGFYSKDGLLGALGATSFSFSLGVYFLGCAFTVAYSLRLIFMGFSIFPSYAPSLRFSDDLFFYFPVIFLYGCCVFFGNFFFYYFCFPLVLGFYDFFLGVVVISLGIVVYWWFSIYYWVLFYFSSLSFLSLLSTYFISSKSIFLSYKTESRWGEVFGGKGFKVRLSYLGLNLVGSYKLYFPLVFILFIVIGAFSS